jgi:ubiquinone/menaquinone biosynthesis C-methylase UbiE
MVLAPMKAHFGDHNGRGLRFLELGSGTGSATRSVARAFPKAKITCLDLSYPYTKHAQKQLREFDRVECIQGDASELEFGDDRFDAVYSVFLFHELPPRVRELALEEARRVVRPDGIFALVDSLQTGDDEELDWALEFFPREFHEPYYAHYTSNPMEGLLDAAGFEDIEGRTGYLAKCLSAHPGN